MFKIRNANASRFVSNPRSEYCNMSVRQPLNVPVLALLGVVFVTALVSWVASKRYYEYQEEGRQNERFWKTTTATLLTFGIIIYSTEPAKRLIRQWNQPDYAKIRCYQSDGGPRERQRDAGFPK